MKYLLSIYPRSYDFSNLTMNVLYFAHSTIILLISLRRPTEQSSHSYRLTDKSRCSDQSTLYRWFINSAIEWNYHHEINGFYSRNTDQQCRREILTTLGTLKTVLYGDPFLSVATPDLNAENVILFINIY